MKNSSQKPIELNESKWNKYSLYLQSVQSPETDALFLQKIYKKLNHKTPQILREDFCGTFALSCEWVKLNPFHFGIGIDLDPEPILYGNQMHRTELSLNQNDRLYIMQKNVLSSQLPSADIIAALNFSYFIFKTRKTMKQYFSCVNQALNKSGLFVLDCFGGSACLEPNEEQTKHSKFTYFWDQKSYDSITQEAKFSIHFKLKNQSKKMKDAFTYDWRLWSLPELRDLLIDSGFKKTWVYWEGTTKKGEGNGKYKQLKSTREICESWVAYIVAQ